MTVISFVPPCAIFWEANQVLTSVAKLDALEKAISHARLDHLDLTMPRMNGFQTARELRAMKISAPSIFFTVSAELVRPEQAPAAGVTAVVATEDLCRLQLHPETLLTE
jgi:CheY-like chemotaxis protein